ncbi:MAG: hypothetical protein SFX18_07685 [Pirellulales bacterium]|nr:hypothetical protein [Pirellulales bacterium]
MPPENPYQSPQVVDKPQRGTISGDATLNQLDLTPTQVASLYPVIAGMKLCLGSMIGMLLWPFLLVLIIVLFFRRGDSISGLHIVLMAGVQVPRCVGLSYYFSYSQQLSCARQVYLVLFAIVCFSVPWLQMVSMIGTRDSMAGLYLACAVICLVYSYFLELRFYRGMAIKLKLNSEIRFYYVILCVCVLVALCLPVAGYFSFYSEVMRHPIERRGDALFGCIFALLIGGWIVVLLMVIAGIRLRSRLVEITARMPANPGPSLQ